ncbi:hypothetical protein GCM10007923_61360 [Shinella yambaruensis]|uniref:Uncharacterized protein n=1 Tax=Shinella yambaruensis TaxID=415996 RepID=A0ABQ5ZT16_9HYPH|nr:hypothetical protein GCM10007923_61360 [Shinella yambaruensis]
MCAGDGVEPDISDHVGKGKHAPAIDDDGKLGRQGKGGIGKGRAQRIGKRRGIGKLGRVDAGKRRHLDGDARLRGNAGRGKAGGKMRNGGFGEAAKLEIAARGDLDEAVAVRPRQIGKDEEVLCRQGRRDGAQAHQKAVAGPHRGGDGGARAAPQRTGFARKYR